MNPVTAQKRGFLVLGSYPDSIVAFRGDLIRAMVHAQWQVTVMTAEASRPVAEEIESLGVDFRPYSIKRNTIDIASDRRTLAELRRAFAELQPDLIMAYTIKPIIWGGIVARRFPQGRFFAMVTGLGYAFQGGSLKRRLLSAAVTFLYRIALKRARAVIFLNADNRDLFVERRIVPAEKCHLVNGEGINVIHFSQAALPPGPAHFLLIARLLGEKGIREYFQAAKQVKARYPDTQFTLVGPEDPSRDGIPLGEIRRWHEAGTIHYHGSTTDVRPFLKACHILVLPSYHEGLPVTVLEAMAMGRPILTTDVSGCKETVQPGTNGWLVPKADANALAERMTWFIENRSQWETMGNASRRLAEEKFDVKKVNARILEILEIEG